MTKRVLVCPLDWGLGHATRCVPLIRELLQFQCVVAIATSGPALALLKLEFPGLPFYQITSYRIRYSARFPLWLSIAWQMPRILFCIRREFRQLNEILKSEKADLVISDCRYGCRNPLVKSIMVTHQLNILLPRALRSLQWLVNRFNHRLISRFDECWVPDQKDRRWTGELTNAPALRPRFIGILSRLAKGASSTPRLPLLAMLSGPEPQRSVFEEKLLRQLRKTEMDFVLLRGIVGANGMAPGPIIDHLKAEELNEMIARADLVICRPGYSSVMDLASLGKSAIFVPTPGQTEQEYLAKRLESSGVAYFQMQSDFYLERALGEAHKYTGFSPGFSHTDLLAGELRRVLQSG